MAYYIQQPVFAPATVVTMPTPDTLVTPVQLTPIVAYASIVPAVNFQWFWTSMGFTACQNPQNPRMKMRVIFFGTQRPGFAPGFWCAATDVAFDKTPERQVLLATLSHWAKHIGVHTPIFAGQARLYITEDLGSTMTIHPGRGAVAPDRLHSTIELTDNPPPPIFKRDVEVIRNRGLGAFLVVNMDLHTQYRPAAQRCSSDNNPDSTVSNVSNSGEEWPRGSDAVSQGDRKPPNGESDLAAPQISPSDPSTSPSRNRTESLLDDVKQDTPPPAGETNPSTASGDVAVSDTPLPPPRYPANPFSLSDNGEDPKPEIQPRGEFKDDMNTGIFLDKGKNDRLEDNEKTPE